MTTPILLRKDSDHDSTSWFYRSNDDFGRISLKNGNLIDQFQSLTDIFEAAYESPLLISASLHTFVLDAMEEYNPETRYACIYHRHVREVIYKNRLWSNTHIPRKHNQGTTYVCSDASGGETVSASSSWAFVSTDSSVGYNFGTMKDASTTSVEFEGICNAIKSHKDSENRVVFYTDSLNTVKFLHGEESMDITRYHSNAIELRDEVRDIIKSRGRHDHIAWVRGHKRQRLNIIADAMAHMARVWDRTDFSRSNHMDGYYNLTQFA